jgi:predicted O-linked N-acetylglucosamine transferase (SPINDLY family)
MSKAPGHKIQNKLQQAVVLHQQGELARAKPLYEAVLKLDPRQADALHLLGVIGLQSQDHALAARLIAKAIAIAPRNASYHSNLGLAQKGLGQLDAALASLDLALQIQPQYTDALSNRGLVLQELQQPAKAIDNYSQVLRQSPSMASAYYNRGNAYQEIKQLSSAVADYDMAIMLQPDYAQAYFNRGNALRELKRLGEAVDSYDNAYRLNPHLPYLLGMRLNTRMMMCDWQNFAADLSELIEGLDRQSSPSFPVIALTDSPQVQQKAAENWIRAKYPTRPELGPLAPRAAGGKIRIAYFSADFHAHPVMYLMAELFELHDKEQFEVLAFSYDTHPDDPMRERVRQAFDQFIDVQNHTDLQIAELARTLQIDIAIDLGGHTQNSRVGIFAYRAASIQVSYIGYLGTMGAEYYDYLLADDILIPPESQKYYTEKIAYLPCYQVNDSQRKISERQFTRSELGLPEKGFVYCCFNNNFKILPATLDSWVRILQAVPGSVLFLYAENKWAKENLQHEVRQRGLAPERLVFGQHLNREDYLARYRLADLFLDTFPYNAGTTASDALWAGLPVLTCMGDSFASRVAASLLTAMRLPELITTTHFAYETTAIELGINPVRCAELRLRVYLELNKTILMNSKKFASHIESIFTSIIQQT